MKKLLLVLTLLITSSLAYCANDSIHLILCSNSNKGDPNNYGAMIFDQGIFFTDTVPHTGKTPDDNDCTISVAITRDYITKNCWGGAAEGYCYAPVSIGESYRQNGMLMHSTRLIGYLIININDFMVHNYVQIADSMNFKVDISTSVDYPNEVRVHLPNS